jgi:hypothetical protein
MSARNGLLVAICCAAVIIAATTMLGQQDSGPRVPRRPSPQSSSETQGYLILDGRLVSPPYDVTIEGERVLVNGKTIFTSYPYRPISEYPRSQQTSPLREQREEASHAFWLEFHQWCKKDGIDVARERAVTYWRHHPLVESVTATPGLSSIKVLFKGGDGFEPSMLLTPLEDPPSPEQEDEVRQAALQQISKSVLGNLRHGSLVLIFGNGNRAYLDDGQRKLQVIRRILETTPDEPTRTRLIHDALGSIPIEWAQVIAERF